MKIVLLPKGLIWNMFCTGHVQIGSQEKMMPIPKIQYPNAPKQKFTTLNLKVSGISIVYWCLSSCPYKECNLPNLLDKSKKSWVQSYKLFNLQIIIMMWSYRPYKKLHNKMDGPCSGYSHVYVNVCIYIFSIFILEKCKSRGLVSRKQRNSLW